MFLFGGCRRKLRRKKNTTATTMTYDHLRAWMTPLWDREISDRKIHNFWWASASGPFLSCRSWLWHSSLQVLHRWLRLSVCGHSSRQASRQKLGGATRGDVVVFHTGAVQHHVPLTLLMYYCLLACLTRSHQQQHEDA